MSPYLTQFNSFKKIFTRIKIIIKFKFVLSILRIKAPLYILFFLFISLNI
jgi:hypothetical protein